MSSASVPGVRSRLSLPLNFSAQGAGDWDGGLGDLIVAFKRVLFAQRPDRLDLERAGRGQLADRQSRQGSWLRRDDLRNVRLVRPDPAAIRLHSSSERRRVPGRPRESASAVYVRTAVGNTFSGNRGFGRSWTPMVELHRRSRTLSAARATNWDIVPQVQVTTQQAPAFRRQPRRASCRSNNTARTRNRSCSFYALVGLVRRRSARRMVGETVNDASDNDPVRPP